MKSWYHSWLAAIRIARRDAWRFKGRSLLVMAMLAVPVIGVSAADVTLRTFQLSTEETLTRTMGSADARLTDPGVSGEPLLQDPTSEDVWRTVKDFEDEPYPSGRTDLAKALPAGATSLTDSTGRAKLRTAHGLLSAEIRELKSTDPMAKRLLTVLDGRLPEKPEEVAATSAFLTSSGLKVGSDISARGFDRTYTIVGSYELPGELELEQINALPGSFLAPLDKALAEQGLAGTEPLTTHLVSVPGGFTWNMVKEANSKGVTALSREVVLNPPATSDIPLFQKYPDYENNYSSGGEEMAFAGTIVGLALLEICLLAGPAFAVGARRSRRQLGLVGANGGDRSHIRSIVLAGGLVIGTAAAVVGTSLGLVLSLVVQPLMEEYAGARFGAFDVRPLELLGIALLAVLTGLAAALVPAVTASRQSVLASLTGRRGVRRSNRVLPTIGLIAVAVGVAIALWGAVQTGQTLLVAAGSAIAELGVVALTPVLVGLFGRFSRFLPLSPRLALRDAVRNRGRTAPAVAAVLAAVAGTIAVATYAASDTAQSRAQYEAMMPHGSVAVSVEEEKGRDVPGVRSTVERMLPVDVRADVDRAVVGDASCAVYDSNAKCGEYHVVIPAANECPLHVSDPARPDAEPKDRFTPAEIRELNKDWRCKGGGGGASISLQSGLAIADAKLLKVLGVNSAEAERALADGKAVSFERRLLDSEGNVGIKVVTDRKAAEAAYAKNEEPPGRVTALPAFRLPAEKAYGLSVIMSPATAKKAGLIAVPYGAYYSTDAMPSSEQRQRLEGELDKTGAEVRLYVERGFIDENSVILLALTVFAGLITIGAAGIATGLAQADAEADLKTLGAIGAPPRVRRTLSGFQCGVVAAMGVVLGSAAGLLPAVGLRFTERKEAQDIYDRDLANGWGGTLEEIPIVLPWPTFAVLLIGVPIGAALLAALVTRSRGALSRRAVN